MATSLGVYEQACHNIARKLLNLINVVVIVTCDLHYWQSYYYIYIAEYINHNTTEHEHSQFILRVAQHRRVMHLLRLVYYCTSNAMYHR